MATVKTFISDPTTITKDCSAGLALTYPEFVSVYKDSHSGRPVLRNPLDPDRVNLIVSSGGGGGPFSPSMVVGPDMADAAINGNICTAPSAYDIYEIAKMIDSKKGYLLLYNNFMGDFLNNDMALELMRNDGYNAELCPICDDILGVPEDAPRSERTGYAGIAMYIKALSKYAKTGASLSDMYAMYQHLHNRISTVYCTLDFDKQTIAFGEGISGEAPKIILENQFSTECIASNAYELLVKDLKPQENEKLHVMISTSHSAKYEDGFILAKDLHEYAEGRKPLKQMSTGHFSDISDAYGFTVTMLCADENVDPLVSHRCFTDAYIL